MHIVPRHTTADDYRPIFSMEADTHAVDLKTAVDHDQATIAQVDRIQEEIAGACKLVEEKEDFSSLAAEYASNDDVYQAKIHDLGSKYCSLRRTRGDGNCFFRAFAFAYLEHLMQDQSAGSSFLEQVTKCKNKLLELGYPQFTLEDFHDTFVDVVESVLKGDTTVSVLTERFQDEGTSNYLVCYLRLLTSGQLQSNSDFFQAFMEGGRTVKEFCSREVEPMYVESDHIHITALTQALATPVRVQYMDRGEGGQVNHHDFPGGSPCIHLLYRPGHYDILYTK